MDGAKPMHKYVAKRLLLLIPILFLVSITIFGMIRLSQVDPVAVILGGKQTTPEVIQNIRGKYNLNQPPVVQYGLWITGIFRGDFGVSYKYQQSVTSLIQARMPITLGLVLISSLIALAVAIPVGVASAIRKNTWVDRTLSIITLVLVSSPVFLTGILMILVVSAVFPQFAFTGSFDGFGEFLERMILPAIALAFTMIALVSRITRSSMIKQLQSDYTLTAVAKGLPGKMVIFKHALKNAVIPVITVTSIQIGAMIVGAVLVENVFSLPGIGSLLVDSIKSSDYPIVQGVTLLLVTVFLLINLAVDVLYAMIDPRIRLQ
jgi:peptide/nickel transport system permease protein